MILHRGGGCLVSGKAVHPKICGWYGLKDKESKRENQTKKIEYIEEKTLKEEVVVCRDCGPSSAESTASSTPRCHAVKICLTA